MAAKLGVSEATISRLFQGHGSFDPLARQSWSRLYPDKSSHEQQNQSIGFILNALKYLDELELVGSFKLDDSSPELAKDFLMLHGLSDKDGQPEKAFFDWLSARRASQAKKRKEPSVVELSVENALDAPPQTQEDISQQETQTYEHLRSRAVGKGHQPRNYVEEICLMRPVEVRQGTDDRLYVILDISLGEERRKFNDLVVAAGLEKLRVKIHLENFGDVRSRHRHGKLRGRIAILNKNEVFVVEETYLGKPSPFLRDSVFEGEAIYSAKLSKPDASLKASVECFIAFSDFDFDVFDADGERLSDFTDDQQNLRKLALKEFIKNRCQTQGFEGTISHGEWVNDVES